MVPRGMNPNISTVFDECVTVPQPERLQKALDRHSPEHELNGPESALGWNRIADGKGVRVEGFRSLPEYLRRGQQVICGRLPRGKKVACPSMKHFCKLGVQSLAPLVVVRSGPTL